MDPGDSSGVEAAREGEYSQTIQSRSQTLIAAESQLGMCKRRIEPKTHPKPRFTAGFRFLWVVLSKLWAPWQAAAQLMQPATGKAWHTRAFRLYWRWKSRRKPGRPPISQEMQDVIRKLSGENPLWGAGQIRDNLLLLHYKPPCEDTIRKYMVKPKGPDRKSTTWLPLLRNHMAVSWAIDFFTVKGRFGKHHGPLADRCLFQEPRACLLISRSVIESLKRPATVVDWQSYGKSPMKDNPA